MLENKIEYTTTIFNHLVGLKKESCLNILGLNNVTPKNNLMMSTQSSHHLHHMQSPKLRDLNAYNELPLQRGCFFTHAKCLWSKVDQKNLQLSLLIRTTTTF